MSTNGEHCTITPSKGTINLFGKIIIDIWQEIQEQQIKDKQRIKKEIRKLEEKRNRADELVLNATLDTENYKRLVESIDVGLRELEITPIETES